MKPPEIDISQYNAWVDGLLNERDRADFEALLLSTGESKRVEAEADRAAALQLGCLLRSQSASAELKNGDFFNHSLLKQIEAEARGRARESAPLAASAPTSPEFSLARLIWAGISCLGVAALLFFALVFPGLNSKGPPVEYYAQIFNTKAGDSAISAVSYHDKAQNVTVLWLDGLDYVPSKSSPKAGQGKH